MITLRYPLNHEHQTLVDWRNANLEYFFSSNLVTLEAHLDWYHEVLLDDSQEFFVIEAQGKIVGTIGLMDINHHHRRAEYGRFLIAEEHRGRGYGREALKAVLKYAFSTLSLHKVYGEILSVNVPALQLCESLGFWQVGTLFSHVVKHGQIEDVTRVAIVASTRLMLLALGSTTVD